eukprot:1147610-Pelagomonas_calceolata.AAC.5
MGHGPQMLDAFAAPDKRIKARTELHQVKQGTHSAKDYIRHVRTLVTKCGPEPPCAVDLLMFFFNGLNPALKDRTAIDLTRADSGLTLMHWQTTSSLWKSIARISMLLPA